MGGMDSQTNYHSKECYIPEEFRQRQKTLIRLCLVSASWDFVKLLKGFGVGFFSCKSSVQSALKLPWVRQPLCPYWLGVVVPRHYVTSSGCGGFKQASWGVKRQYSGEIYTRMSLVIHKCWGMCYLDSNPQTQALSEFFVCLFSFHVALAALEECLCSNWDGKGWIFISPPSPFVVSAFILQSSLEMQRQFS